MFKVGDVIDYCFYTNLLIINMDEKTYHLKDKTGNVRAILKSLIDKYGKLKIRKEIA